MSAAGTDTPIDVPERRRPLRCAMVGGGRDAFIGGVHRKAMALDGRIALVAGAFSSQPDKAFASGRELGVADDRNHASWQALLDHELSLPADERIHFVVVVTPNHVHYEVAKAFAEAGIAVVCDKPLVNRLEEAHDLADTVRRTGGLFAVTYNYSGYPMVREAREMVKGGALGTVRKVVAEYHQGWLAAQVEAGGNKQAAWRTDPGRSGVAGAMGDIGSHAENLVATVTGLELESICADLSTFVPGRRLDDDGSVLLRFSNGARGALLASQIEAGCENDIRLRVFGTDGMVEWRQEEPNLLVHAPADGPKRILTRGSPWLSDASRRACRLPPGHPEAFIEAFANVYQGVAEDLEARLAGHALSPLEGDYPRIDAGVRGVHFIEKVVESSKSTAKWTAMG